MGEQARVEIAPFDIPELSAEEFAWVSRFLHQESGILLKQGKEPLVRGRLEKRLRHHGLSTFSEYFARLGMPGHESETSLAIDLLTTNETSFLREPKHFEFLRTKVIAQREPGRALRIWSAASSTGEEAYTIAMTLADALNEGPWEVCGTDISTRVVEQANKGMYPMSAADKVPVSWLKRYCLKGRDDYSDFFMIGNALRLRVKFIQANLMQPLPSLGLFDTIFLRNVMIYFDQPTRVSLVDRLLALLRPGGYFIVSHSESLNGITNKLESLGSSIYRLPEK